MGLARAVHLHLAGAGAAAHAQVLQRSAEARQLVPLEVGEGDDDVRVHDGRAYLGLLDVGAALEGDQPLVQPPQAAMMVWTPVAKGL